MGIIQRRMGMKMSYSTVSTALRKKHRVVNDVHGNPKRILLYNLFLFCMLENINFVIVTKVELDKNKMFKYYFTVLAFRN